MKYREKLGYIALGGFLMLVGMLAAGLTSPIGAFNNAPDAVFRTITCEKVRVLDSERQLQRIHQQRRTRRECRSIWREGRRDHDHR